MAYDGFLKFDTKIDSSGFQKGINSIAGIAQKGMKATCDILKGATVAISGIGTAAVKVGSDFEAAMSKVEAISGASGKDLEALTAKAKEMGATTKFSATESANAFEYMAMAGWKTGDMLDGIEGIMNLAAASGEDLATTSDIVTDALTAFGMKASDSSHFADVLAQASASANTNVGMLGESFKYVAPVAGSMAYSAEDTAVALGLMANAGIKASSAGTALRTLITNMARPTSNMGIAMDALGVSLENSDGSMKSLMDVMKDLRTGFGQGSIDADEFSAKMAELQAKFDDGKLSQEDYDEAVQNLTVSMYGAEGAEKARLAAMLAGKEGMAGLLAIVNTSEEDFQKLTDSIYACDGAAAKMAETMNDNVQGQITILKSGLEGLGISLYENMQAPCMEIVKTAQDMVQQLQEAFNDGGLDSLVTAFGDVLAQIVEKAASAAPDLINAAVGLVGSFCDSLKRSPGVGDAAASLITALVTGLFSCVGDIWTAAIALAGKMADGLAEGAPEMAQAAARCVGDIIECLWEWAPDFIDAGKRIIQGIIQGIREEFPALGAFLSGLFEGFTSTLEPILGGVIGIVQGIFNALAGADPAVMEALGKALGTIAAAMVTMHAAKAAAGNIKMAASTVSSFAGSVKTAAGVVPKLIEGFQLLSGGAGTFSEVLALEFPKLAAAFSKIGSVFSAVKAVIGAIGSTVAGVAAVIGGAVLAVTNFFDMLKNGFSWLKEILMVVGVALAAIGAVILGAPAAVAAAIAGIVAAVATLIVAIKDHWNQIAEFFTGIGTAIVEFFAGIPDAVGGVVDNVAEFFTGLPEKIGAWLTSAAERVKTWGIGMASAAGEAASDFIGNVVTFFSELPNKIAYCLGYAIGTVIKWGVNLANWVKTEVPKIIDGIVAFFSKLPGKIWAWLVNAANKVVEWGRNVHKAASTWAKNAVDSAVKFFSELPGKVWKWLTDVMNKIGQWGRNLLTAAGTAAKNAIDKVTEWFKQLPGKVWDWLTNTVDKAGRFASNLAAKATEAAKGFVEKLIDGVKSLPESMLQIGKDIVTGIWNGIASGWNWLIDKVGELAGNLFQGAKDALGINSPSKVFAREVGRWIPPGIGVGVEAAMPDLEKQLDGEMESLAARMQAAVAFETGSIEVRKNIEQTYKAEIEKGQSFESGSVEVNIGGDIHTHVDLDGKEIGNATTPIVDKNMGRIDIHKRRGG